MDEDVASMRTGSELKILRQGMTGGCSSNFEVSKSNRYLPLAQLYTHTQNLLFGLATPKWQEGEETVSSELINLFYRRSSMVKEGQESLIEQLDPAQMWERWRKLEHERAAKEMTPRLPDPTCLRDCGLYISTYSKRTASSRKREVSVCQSLLGPKSEGLMKFISESNHFNRTKVVMKTSETTPVKALFNIPVFNVPVGASEESLTLLRKTDSDLAFGIISNYGDFHCRMFEFDLNTGNIMFLASADTKSGARVKDPMVYVEDGKPGPNFLMSHTFLKGTVSNVSQLVDQEIITSLKEGSQDEINECLENSRRTVYDHSRSSNVPF
jgi:hypothetical protein